MKTVQTLLTFIAVFLGIIAWKFLGIEATTGDWYALGFLSAIVGLLWMMPVLMGSLLFALIVACPIALYAGMVWYTGLAMVLVLWSCTYDFVVKRITSTAHA